MNWWRRLVDRSRLESELDRELHDHLDRQAADFRRAGMSEQEARRRAVLRLGGIEPIKELCRDVRPLHLVAELGQDLQAARRSLARSPFLSAGVIFSLGIAIGSNAAIFSAVNTVLFQPLGFFHPEELAMVWKADAAGSLESGVAPANAIEMRRHLKTASSVSAFTATEIIVQEATDAERVPAARVSSDFLHNLGVEPFLGRGLDARDEVYGAAPVVVISHEFWTRRFGGDTSVLGRSIGSSQTRYTVVGVLPETFRFPEVLGTAFRPDVWMPLQFSPEEASVRGAGYMFLVLRRRADISWHVVTSELNEVTREYARLEPDHYGARRLVAVPLHEQVVRSVRGTLLALWAGVACVLALACANTANVLLSRGLARSRELAVRASLGASRWRLVRQLLTEGVVFGVSSAGVGLALAVVLTRMASAELADVLPRASAVTVDAPVLAFTALVAMVTGLAVGVLPAAQLSRVAPFESLRHAAWGTTDGRWGSSLRGALLVVQIGLAVVLVTAAALLGRSFAAVERVDLGFNPHRVTTFEVSTQSSGKSRAAAAEFYARLLDRLRTVPGVVAAGAFSQVPLSGSDFSWTFLVRDHPRPAGEALPHADVRIVTPGALEALQVPLRVGRTFLAEDRADSQSVAIINERFARQAWPAESPLGKQIKLEGPVEFLPWMTVVGVVADLRFGALDREAPPAIYRPETQHPWTDLTLVVRTVGDTPLTDTVRAEISAIDGTASLLRVRPMSDFLSASVARRRIVSGLVTSFAAVALGLALLGIYSAFAYLTSLRTREFGVRIALGARRTQIVNSVLRRVLIVAIPGLACGVLASYASRRLLAGELYHVDATDPVTLVIVAALVLATALVASAWPALRAANTDPTTALRVE